MAYRPLREPGDLPKEGAKLGEDLRFDMKMTIFKQFLKRLGGDESNPAVRDVTELARDVAAFANTAGGVLLLGAQELPNNPGVLHAYVPMAFPETEAIAVMLSRALKQCSPAPIAEARRIELSDRPESYVVAINCDPYAAPPIGVSQPGASGGEKWWAFPVRRGRDNRNLRPEELATIMEPKLRRILLLLSKIPIMDYHNTQRALFVFLNNTIAMDILGIEHDTLSMHLIDRAEHHELIVPLDAVDMIWSDTRRGMYKVAMRGGIRLVEDRSRYEFIPRF